MVNANNTLDGINTMMNKAISNLAFNRTIIGQIVETYETEPGVYLVTNGSSEFKAYSQDTNLKKGDNVQILIPNGDYNEQKIILGKIEDKNIPLEYKDPKENIAILSKNLFKKVSGQPIVLFEWLENEQYYSSKVFRYIFSEKDLLEYNLKRRDFINQRINRLYWSFRIKTKTNLNIFKANMSLEIILNENSDLTFILPFSELNGQIINSDPFSLYQDVCWNIDLVKIFESSKLKYNIKEHQYENVEDILNSYILKSIDLKIIPNSLVLTDGSIKNFNLINSSNDIVELVSAQHIDKSLYNDYLSTNNFYFKYNNIYQLVTENDYDFLVTHWNEIEFYLNKSNGYIYAGAQFNCEELDEELDEEQFKIELSDMELFLGMDPNQIVESELNIYFIDNNGLEKEFTEFTEDRFNLNRDKTFQYEQLQAELLYKDNNQIYRICDKEDANNINKNIQIIWYQSDIGALKGFLPSDEDDWSYLNKYINNNMNISDDFYLQQKSIYDKASIELNRVNEDTTIIDKNNAKVFNPYVNTATDNDGYNSTYAELKINLNTAREELISFFKQTYSFQEKFMFTEKIRKNGINKIRAMACIDGINLQHYSNELSCINLSNNGIDSADKEQDLILKESSERNGHYFVYGQNNSLISDYKNEKKYLLPYYKNVPLLQYLEENLELGESVTLVWKFNNFENFSNIISCLKTDFKNFKITITKNRDYNKRDINYPGASLLKIELDGYKLQNNIYEEYKETINNVQDYLDASSKNEYIALRNLKTDEELMKLISFEFFVNPVMCLDKNPKITLILDGNKRWKTISIFEFSFGRFGTNGTAFNFLIVPEDNKQPVIYVDRLHSKDSFYIPNSTIDQNDKILKINPEFYNKNGTNITNKINKIKWNFIHPDNELDLLLRLSENKMSDEWEKQIECDSPASIYVKIKDDMVYDGANYAILQAEAIYGQMKLQSYLPIAIADISVKGDIFSGTNEIFYDSASNLPFDENNIIPYSLGNKNINVEIQRPNWRIAYDKYYYQNQLLRDLPETTLENGNIITYEYLTVPDDEYGYDIIVGAEKITLNNNNEEIDSETLLDDQVFKNVIEEDKKTNRLTPLSQTIPSLNNSIPPIKTNNIFYTENGISLSLANNMAYYIGDSDIISIFLNDENDNEPLDILQNSLFEKEIKKYETLLNNKTDDLIPAQEIKKNYNMVQKLIKEYCCFYDDSDDKISFINIQYDKLNALRSKIFSNTTLAVKNMYLEPRDLTFKEEESLAVALTQAQNEVINNFINKFTIGNIDLELKKGKALYYDNSEINNDSTDYSLSLLGTLLSNLDTLLNEKPNSNMAAVYNIGNKLIGENGILKNNYSFNFEVDSTESYITEITNCYIIEWTQPIDYVSVTAEEIEDNYIPNYYYYYENDKYVLDTNKNFTNGRNYYRYKIVFNNNNNCGFTINNNPNNLEGEILKINNKISQISDLDIDNFKNTTHIELLALMQTIQQKNLKAIQNCLEWLLKQILLYKNKKIKIGQINQRNKKSWENNINDIIDEYQEISESSIDGNNLNERFNNIKIKIINSGLLNYSALEDELEENNQLTMFQALLQKEILILKNLYPTINTMYYCKKEIPIDIKPIVYEDKECTRPVESINFSDAYYFYKRTEDIYIKQTGINKITEDNWEEKKSLLYYKNNETYIKVSNNDTYESYRDYYILEKNIIHLGDNIDIQDFSVKTVKTIINNEPQISYFLSPAKIYADGDCAIIIKDLNNKILWEQPILIQKNYWPSTLVNQWDGKLTIDEENNAILSAMVVAGTKDGNNKFSGVMMGEIQGDKENSLSQHGIYGFSHGEQSYAFKQDGTAFIGTNDGGRIHFDGNKGTIESANFSMESIFSTNNIQGLQIDLKNGILRAEGAYLNNGHVSGDFFATSLHAGGEDFISKVQGLDSEIMNIKEDLASNALNISEIGKMLGVNPGHNINDFMVDADNSIFFKFGEVFGTGDTTIEISKDGLLTATNAIISGTIYATDGIFSGTIYGNSGRIGGMNITEGKLLSISKPFYRKYNRIDSGGYILSGIQPTNELNWIIGDETNNWTSKDPLFLFSGILFQTLEPNNFTIDELNGKENVSNDEIEQLELVKENNYKQALHFINENLWTELGSPSNIFNSPGGWWPYYEISNARLEIDFMVSHRGQLLTRSIYSGSIYSDSVHCDSVDVERVYFHDSNGNAGTIITDSSITVSDIYCNNTINFQNNNIKIGYSSVNNFPYIQIYNGDEKHQTRITDSDIWVSDIFIYIPNDSEGNGWSLKNYILNVVNGFI